MKTVVLALIALGFSLSAMTPRMASAGAGSSAGGADNLPIEDGSAWFPGAGRPIKVCTQVAADFTSLKGLDYAGLIAGQFKVWQRYIAQKHIEDGLSPVLQLSFALNFIPSCDGTQDIAFYFGVDNDDVKAGKGEFSDPLAFAYRKSYDHAKDWGNGYVWIHKTGEGQYSRLWNDVNQLKVTLSHEIGHVLGNSHYTGTLMDQNISEWVFNSTGGGSKPIQYYADHVDGPSEQLYWCYTCSNEVKGTIGVAKHWDSIPGFDPAITFRRFVGRAPVGKIRAVLQMQFQENDQHPFKTIGVTYSDDHGSKAIPFEMRIGGTSVDASNNSRAFFVMSFTSATGGHSVSPVRGILVEGYARDARGKRVPITVYLNTGNRPGWAEIDYANGLNDLPFFRAYTPEF